MSQASRARLCRRVMASMRGQQRAFHPAADIGRMLARQHAVFDRDQRLVMVLRVSSFQRAQQPSVQGTRLQATEAPVENSLR